MNDNNGCGCFLILFFIIGCLTFAVIAIDDRDDSIAGYTEALKTAAESPDVVVWDHDINIWNPDPDAAKFELYVGADRVHMRALCSQDSGIKTCEVFDY